MTAKTIKVLDRALSIFEHLSANEELSLKEMAEISVLNRTTVYRILQSLLEWNYIEKNPVSKKYSASLRIVEIAGTVLRRIDVIKVAHPYILRLRDESEESAFIAVLNGFNIVFADWEPSHHDAYVRGFIGRSVPAYSSGAGKAILAHLPEEELNRLLEKHELIRYTPNTIIDPHALKQDLKKTSSRGYGISLEEFGIDAIVVAAPIFNISNKVIASIAVAALKSRANDDEHLKKLGKMVGKLASKISKKMGSTFHS